MFTFARPCRSAQIVELLPKPVTIYDPVVRLKVDMSRDDVSEYMLPHPSGDPVDGLQFLDAAGNQTTTWI